MSRVARLAFLLLAALMLTWPGAAARAEGDEGRRVALLIANGVYPDANVPILSAAKDVRLLADELRRYDFDTAVEENAGRRKMQDAVDAFLAKLDQNAVGLIYFTGFGIQVARQTYFIPVDARIWTEADVKRDGVSLDAILAGMDRRGARVKIVIVDAARRNPYERRFRPVSAGLAGIDAPDDTLVLYAAPPGKTTPDDSRDQTLFMSELAKELRSPGIAAEEVFTHTRVGVSRASNGEQVPWVASSLVEDFRFGREPSDLDPEPASPPRTEPPPSAGPAANAPRPPPDRADPPVRTTAPPAVASATGAAPGNDPPPSGTPPSGPTPPVVPAAGPDPSPPPVPDAPSSQAPPVPSTSVPATPVATTPVADTPRGPGDRFRDCADCPDMVVLPAGSFDMGSGSTPFDRPVHKVALAAPFAMAVNEVTMEAWERCAAAGACRYRPDAAGPDAARRPVVNVTWYDAKDYAAWMAKLTGRPYRLPSEAEWEYAARGGAATPFAWGATVGAKMANCRDCQSGVPHQAVAVGSFPPNGYGLFDMAGNAAEWVEDCWNDTYRGAPADGAAWVGPACAQRVLRGGSFDSTAAYVKPAARFRYDADVRYYANGFRLVRSLP